MSQRERRRKKPCEYKKVKLFHVLWMLSSSNTSDFRGSKRFSVTLNACEMSLSKACQGVSFRGKPCEDQGKKHLKVVFKRSCLAGVEKNRDLSIVSYKTFCLYM